MNSAISKFPLPVIASSPLFCLKFDFNGIFPLSYSPSLLFVTHGGFPKTRIFLPLIFLFICNKSTLKMLSFMICILGVIFLFASLSLRACVYSAFISMAYISSILSNTSIAASTKFPIPHVGSMTIWGFTPCFLIYWQTDRANGKFVCQSPYSIFFLLFLLICR